MIISIHDDGGVELHDTLEEAQREYEGVDVESGGVAFYDDEGHYLHPVFVKPNKYGWFSVESGTYVLERATIPPHADPLPLALAEAAYLTPSKHAITLDDLRRRFPYTPSN